MIYCDRKQKNAAGKGPSLASGGVVAIANLERHADQQLKDAGVTQRSGSHLSRGAETGEVKAVGGAAVGWIVPSKRCRRNGRQSCDNTAGIPSLGNALKFSVLL
jgi:hypothetical protein